MDTDHLIAQAQTGQESAREALFARVVPRLTTYVAARLGRQLRERMETMDVVQDVLLSAYRSLDRFSSSGQRHGFVRWLYAIAEHRILDHVDHAGAQRRSSERPTDPAVERVLSQFTSPSAGAARAEARSTLIQALDALDPRSRGLVLEHWFLERSAEEIAETMHMTPRHVRRLLRLAEEHLAALLGGPVDLSNEAELPRAVGRFEVRRLLGRGSLGVVYAALDPQTNEEVAVKVLAFDSTVAAERLTREGEALRRLDHPGIVRVREVGVAERPFIVMDLVEGRSLASAIADGPFGVEPALRIAHELAEAVAYAHGLGILHRDIKPHNVLLPMTGRAVLVDFSLAKLEGIDGGTQRGQLMGSAGYSAPELVRGDTAAIGPAADVYGLGATLYALLVGRPPVGGKTVASRVEATLHGEVIGPSALVAGVTPAVDLICVRCLAKDPANRYPSARALADALHAALNPRA